MTSMVPINLQAQAPQWQQSSQSCWRPGSIKVSPALKGPQQRWQLSNSEVEVNEVANAEAEEVEADAGLVEEPEAPETPEIFKTKLKVHRVRAQAMGSGLPATPDGKVQDILTCLHSTRARSTGTGGNLQDSVRNPGNVHGRSSTVNLATNETGTSPNHQ